MKALARVGWSQFLRVLRIRLLGQTGCGISRPQLENQTHHCQICRPAEIGHEVTFGNKNHLYANAALVSGLSIEGNHDLFDLGVNGVYNGSPESQTDTNVCMCMCMMTSKCYRNQTVVEPQWINLNQILCGSTRHVYKTFMHFWAKSRVLGAVAQSLGYTNFWWCQAELPTEQDNYQLRGTLRKLKLRFKTIPLLVEMH